MAQTVLLKRSSVAGNVPGSSDLSLGEIAVNTADGAVYIKKGNNDIVAVADNDILHIDTTNSRVGIGTTSPNRNLHIIGQYTVENSTSPSGALLFIPSSDANRIYSRVSNASSSSRDLAFLVGSTEAMRIDSSGGVIVNNGGSGNGIVKINGATGSTEAVIFQRGGTEASRIGHANSADLTFSTGSGVSERMRLDASGNFLVDKTAIGLNTVGFEVRPNGIMASTRDGGSSAYFNRKTSDGSVVEFQKDGTTVGSIGTVAGRFYIGNDDTFITFKGSTDTIYPATATGGPRDNAISLGDSGTKFKDLYLSGTANVSGLNINSAYTFPTADGSANQFLQTDGSGALTFASATVSDISDLTATATELNYLDGVTGITLGSANELLVVGGDGSSIVSDSTLAVDTSNNRLGINQSSPEVTLHMTGEGAQTAQIRMEQYNDSADAPDVRTRRYRGTIASPSAIQSGDYLFRSNHEYYNGSALIVGGQFAFDNTNNANRTQFTVAVTTDGTSVDASTLSDVQFKIDGNDSGAITFNNAYKFPTSDGSANQVLATDGSGALSFVDAASGGGVSISNNANNRVLTGDGTNANAEANLTFDGSTLVLTGDMTVTDSTNDPFIRFQTSEQEYVVRIDNDDSDKFQIRDVTNSVTRFSIDTSGDITVSGDIHLADTKGIYLGGSNDLQLYHNATDSFMVNETGNLYIRNRADDKDIFIQTDDGSGGVTTYMAFDGSNNRIITYKNVTHSDNVRGRYGSANDLQIFHDATDSFITNATGTFYIDQKVDDGNLILRSDDGSGGLADYIRLDGSETSVRISQHVKVPDNKVIYLGTDNDLQIWHSSTNSLIDHTGTGNLYLRNTTDDASIYLQSDNGSGGLASYIIANGSSGTVTLSHYGSQKLVTKSDGVDITGELQSDSLDVDGAADISGNLNTGPKVAIRNGTTYVQSTDYLYIGGSGLDGSDGAIYLGNNGAGNGYGWRFFYEGSGTGNLNKLIIRSENSGSPVDALSFTQDGNATFGGTLEATSFSDGTISGITFIDEDSFSTNSATRVPTQQSIKAYVDAQVAGVVDSAPAALNTLNELAAALGDDASFSTTTSTALGNRLRVDTASQGLTGTQQANAITNLGITATKAELNYVDGVTSNIQTQLDGKQASGSYLTGNQTITLSGDVSGSGTTSIAVTIADDSHNHVISNVDGLQTALDGKLSTTGTAANSQLLDSLDSSQFLRSDANDTTSGSLGGGLDSALYGFTLPQNPEGKHIKSPFFFNDIAYARLRGATVSVDVDGTAMTSTSAIDAMLNASGDFWNMTTSGVTTATITITNSPKTLTYGSYIGISFGNVNWRAKNVTLQYSTDGGSTWTTARSVTNQSEEFVIASFGLGAGVSVTAFRWILSNFNTTSMRVASIFAYNYNSGGMKDLYVSRDGGSIHSSISISGNIAVSGTVDGRDVASDGSKLDGIESGATADQTITLSGDVSGSGTTSIAVTVADDSHNHVISNVDGLQTALDGKLSTSGTASQANNLNAIDDRDIAPEDLNYSDDLRIYFADKGGLETGTVGSNYQDVLVLNSYNDATGGDANALAFDKSEKKIYHYQADQAATNWGTAKTLAYTDSNISGTSAGLSGTPNISVGTNTATRFIQNGSVSNDLYAADFSRSGSGITTPDIWGSNNTLVIGTSSSVEVIGMQNSDATFYGDIYAKDSNSTTDPTIAFVGHTDTGLSVSLSGSNDQLSVITDGVRRAYFNQSGITSSGNVYTGNESEFRNYGGTWKATTGVTGNGFQFINSVDGTAMTISSTGNVVCTGSLSATTKSFDIEHPSKKGMRLHHGVVEGPEHSVYVRGKSKEKVILLPDYWVDLIHEDTITVQLTAIGSGQDLYVEDIKDNKVFVNGDNYFYYVQAERKDIDRFEVEYEG